jgi:hypothetical protein
VGVLLFVKVFDAFCDVTSSALIDGDHWVRGSTSNSIDLMQSETRDVIVSHQFFRWWEFPVLVNS